MGQPHQLHIVHGHAHIRQTLLESLARDLVKALSRRHGLAPQLLHRADRRLGRDDERVLLIVTTEGDEVRTRRDGIRHTRQGELAHVHLTGDRGRHQRIGVQQAELHIETEVIPQEVHRPERTRQRSVREARATHHHRLALDPGPDVGDRLGLIHHPIVGRSRLGGRVVGRGLGGLGGGLRCGGLGRGGGFLIRAASRHKQGKAQQQCH